MEYHKFKKINNFDYGTQKNLQKNQLLCYNNRQFEGGLYI